MQSQIDAAAQVLRSGGVVAYPTESCFGLGCDPRNKVAVSRILDMKRRPFSKGVILLADRFDVFRYYLERMPEDVLARMHETWPGPYTWICPARNGVSRLLKGQHQTLAVRVSAHPPAARISRAARMCIVSTSANVATRPPLRTPGSVKRVFGGLVDLIVDLPIGGEALASRITNAMTGEVVRI